MAAHSRAGNRRHTRLISPYGIGLVVLGLVTSLSACNDERTSVNSGNLLDVYQADTIWNGITITNEGRSFVCFPHGEGDPGTRIGEVINNKVVPYPTSDWNNWKPGADARQKFVRTNALRIGPDGNLWIVDTGTPMMDAAVVPNGPKLVVVSVATNQVVRTIPLDALVREKSFVDDLRFNRSSIYLTDAGAPGLIVLNAQTGQGRRLLDNDTSTTDRRPMYGEGKILRKPSGEEVRLHADQLEVSPDGKYFYFQPSSGPMYRVETRYLDDPAVSSADLARQVKFFFDTPTTGGTAIDADGNLYVSDTNLKRILKITPDASASTLIQDDRLIWADALWIDNSGSLWIPAAQLNRTPGFQQGVSTVQFPVHIYKLPIGARPLRN